MSLRGSELKSRVQAEQKKLEARISELKADALGKAADERDRLKARLEELRTSLKSGWDNLTEETQKRLNDWLKRDD
jgi:hypothetical protein